MEEACDDLEELYPDMMVARGAEQADSTLESRIRWSTSKRVASVLYHRKKQWVYALACVSCYSQEHWVDAPGTHCIPVLVAALSTTQKLLDQ